MDIKIIENILIPLLLISVFFVLIFFFLSWIGRSRFFKFSDRAAGISAIAAGGFFLLLILAEAFNSLELPYILMGAGLFLAFSAGVIILVKGFSASIIASRKSIFFKLLLLFFTPLSFILIVLGAVEIMPQKNLSAGFEGLLCGTIAGFLSALIAYKQQLPKWRVAGFSRAKMPEEKQIVAEAMANQLPIVEKTLSRTAFFGSYWFYLLIDIAVSIIFGYAAAENFEAFLVDACFSFAVSLLGVYIFLAVWADKKIRAEFKNKNIIN